MTPDTLHINQGIVLAKRAARLSDDPKTQVGIVIQSAVFDGSESIGHTSIEAANSVARRRPPGSAWRSRPEIYNWVGHAEQIAVAKAARLGVPIERSTAFIWSSRPLFCCAPCANSLVAAGVRHIVFHATPDFEGDDAERYGFNAAREIFHLNGVAYRFLEVEGDR